MKICIVNEGFNMGGAEKVIVELANLLQKEGHQLSLIDFTGNNKIFYEVNKEIWRPSIIKQRTLWRKIVGKILKLNSQFSRKLLSVYELHKEQTQDLISFLKGNKYDVLIMNQGTLTSLIPIIKKEIPKLKVIAWQHTEYEVYINQYCKKYIDDYLLGIKRADLVICLTSKDQKKFVELNKNTCYIYNPLTIKGGGKISDLNSKRIVFVGRLKLETKGLDHLIEIGKNLKDSWEIVVAGDGPDKQKFLNMIKSNKLENKIILKGSLRNNELVDLYLSGSIFISTSRWEGFGLVVTEAMSFGLPIVSFNNNGPLEILRSGEYGILIEKNDVNDFISKLNELVESLEKREYFQQKSLERTSDFKADVILREWEDNLIRL